MTQNDNRSSYNNNFTFDTLGKWRKIWIVIYWAVCLLVGVLAFSSKEPSVIIWLVIWLVLLVPYWAWASWAISKRKVTQLKWLCGLALFPMLNPVLSAMIWMTIGVSNKEISEGGEVNPSNEDEASPSIEDDGKYYLTATNEIERSSPVMNSKDSGPDYDEKYYQMADKEFQSAKNEAVWTKALTLENGDAESAKFRYITLRVKQLVKQEIEARSAQDKKIAEPIEPRAEQGRALERENRRPSLGWFAFCCAVIFLIVVISLRYTVSTK